ncbi:putative plant lipid transfer protein/Par allergen [Arabidopsis thaliana]|uniref:Non-specific lipid-transfer protein 3 n=4 Tax=Arabidopsis TaxID=3701 RepID=NLTP3_ARATH|nr:lipid transfer protein 3 [Arabidopsis thaliana]Q9LLR7.1 RecName: Full=Non-specific lipid-transfer protein 3; Short=LTP 3; Flags: Precursor [Arabidopsis thaliana]KAG7606639.1 Bifunctional inhibitor/plant lipid transfer protein/seed storage helical domain [Arabidopsis thaliana x Arabidopsis arenosa]KAG7613552.1 Bifunctional inhibitor/plant lipid transfer protein/seed storage helical domain [Arabidopsis suecica]AAF76929.1 lipid transfer protein 3 [Arabidopsis thaliana]AAL38769.1 putative nonsp|eukprot:NP_568905.1 lipid transfer protein 3 [Arabidopsis thaliana]
MAFALRFFTCLVLTVCIVASVDAAISCGTVAGSLAPCATYLSKGGLVPPSCCAGVKTLNSMAKTTPDRQQACRCIQSTAKSISGLNPSLASGLPGKCGVSIPYPISMSTNCNNIK